VMLAFLVPPLWISKCAEQLVPEIGKSGMVLLSKVLGEWLSTAWHPGGDDLSGLSDLWDYLVCLVCQVCHPASCPV